MGWNLIKTMGKRIILIVIGMSVLWWGLPNPAPVSPCNTSSIRGAIIPHHLFVESYIEAFYKTLENFRITTVVVLSPNHFNSGYAWIQLDSGLLNSDEHGITVHADFIRKHFPNATIHPIIFKRGTPQTHIDSALKKWLEDADQNTFVIASIDFTHLESEIIALQNDARTIQWLSEWSQKGSPREFSLEELKALAQTVGADETLEADLEAVAMDSPESLYALLKWMEHLEITNFNFWKRTSSNGLTGLDLPASNTSHIFVSFSGAQTACPRTNSYRGKRLELSGLIPAIGVTVPPVRTAYCSWHRAPIVLV